MALEQVRFELGHMGENINEMFSTLRSGIREKNAHKYDAVMKLDNKVDILHDAILEYLREIRQQPLTDKQSNRFQALILRPSGSVPWPHPALSPCLRMYTLCSSMSPRVRDPFPRSASSALDMTPYRRTYREVRRAGL